MAKQIGRLGNVGIGIESTKGTKVAATYWIPVQSWSVDDKYENIKNDSAQGRLEEFNASHPVKYWSEGDYEGKIFADSVGAELVALFGQSPTSVERGTSDVYDHAYALKNDNDHKALTVCYEDTVQEVSFPFSMIDTWGLEIAPDDYVKRSVSVMGKKSSSSTHTPAFTNEVEFIPSQVAFKMASTAAGLDAASAISVTAFNMEIAKNAEALYAVGSNEPNDIINKQFGVTGTVELYFENTTYRALALANTHQALRIDMIDTTVDLGTGHNPQLRFDLNEVVFEEFERSWDANDPLSLTLNFEALFKRADASMISARLTNTVASY